MKKLYILIILAGALAFVLTWFHLVYWCDIVAEVTGYYVAFFLPPTLFYVVLLFTEKIFFPSITLHNLKSAWPVFIIGLILAYGPVIYYVIFMTFFHVS